MSFILKTGAPIIGLIALFSALTSQARDLTQADRDAFARCRELQKSGDWLGARDIARELATAFAADPPSQHRLAFLNELANLEQRLGNYEAALPAYEDVLATALTLLGEATAPTAQIQNNLAALHQVLGRFEEAEALNRTALTTRETLEGKGGIGTVPAMNNLAGLLWCIGDLGGAESLYREALAIRVRHLGETALDTARSRANLGGLLFYRDDLAGAAPLTRAAVDTFIREAGPTHPDTLEAILFLGEVERAGGNPQAALAHYRDVFEGRLAAFGTRSHVEVAEALRRIGDAHRELGDYAAAREKYAEADRLYLELLREDHPDRHEGLYGNGLAVLAAGDQSAAKALAEDCFKLEFQNLEAVIRFTDERQRLAYQGIFKSQHLFAQLGDAEGIARFLLWQKGVVIDSLIAEAQLARESDSPLVESARRELAAARAEYRAVFLSGERSGRAIPDLDTLVRERQRALLSALGAKDLDRPLERPTLDQLRNALGADEVLLDYVRYRRYDGLAKFEDRYGLAATTRERSVFFDLCQAKELEDIVAEMIPFFGYPVEGDQQDDAKARSFMETLHRLLLAPATASLTNKPKLIVCPERALNFVPFTCLVGPDGKFLVESHDVRYATSGRELLKAPAPNEPARGALLVGNPTFDTGIAPQGGVADRRGLLASFSAASLVVLSEQLAPLAGAEAEVELLGPVLESRLGTPTSLVKGAAATEKELRGTVRRPHLIHFATHGLYLPSVLAPASTGAREQPFVPKEVAGFQNPMFGSCLALAGSSDTFAAWSRGLVPDPPTDGVLMANEVADLDLEGTLLAVLSACDTASGEVTEGDGVLGLRRGFRLAGAENVLTTLWPISDAATVAIMKQFYEGLAVVAPATSLSTTQREWLPKIRDKTTFAPDDPIPVGGFYWAVNLAGPFLLGR